MLQAIRDRAMGVLGWIVIGLITITFALFGLGSYLQDQSRVFAAKVNDSEISMRDLQVAYQNQRARLEQMLGDAFSPAMIDEKLLKQRALDSLIQRELLLQAAEAAGLAVSDQLLAAQIQAIPAFQENGRFEEERYQAVLMREGQVPAGFEYDTRRLMTAEQLINGYSVTSFVTQPEVERAFQLQGQKRSFDYILVAAKPLEDAVELSEEDIKAYYEEHSDEFITPERVRLAYLRLNAESIGAGVEIEEEAVSALYEQKKTTLKTQETRRASHILFQLSSDADEESVNKVKAQAEAVLQEIRGGADFAGLAKQHSGDPGSADQGGDLGYFATGAMVPEFDEAVFSMEVDTVSDPVRSQFGIHIIKLTDIKGSEMQSLEEVREDLIAQLKQREIDDLYYDQLERLTDSSYENSNTLEAAADELQLEIQTSDWMTASKGNGIGEYPQVLAAAFTEDVLEAGNNSEPVEVGTNDAIVVRVVEREPAQPTPLEAVRESIVAAMKAQAAAVAARDKGEQLLSDLNDGAAMQALADASGQELRQAEAVGRDGAGHSQELVRQVFKLPRPAGETGTGKAFALGNGDYAVVSLTRVDDADPHSMDEAQRTQLTRGYENMRRNQALAVLVEGLRKQAVIEIPGDSE